MFKKLMKTLNVLMCTVLIFQLVGCGTIMYPERKGQKSGKIDSGVAILNGVGLLFFLVPGIIAFAVDFNNGTIYLPGTARGPMDLDDMKQVKFDPKNTSRTDIERMIKEQVGYTVKLDQPSISITELDSTDAMIARFTQTVPDMSESLALNH